MSDFNQCTKKQLLALPIREWDKKSSYDSILVVPSGKKHDSGYHLMTVIGVRSRQPIEIAAYCDDISWVNKTQNNLRNDMPQRARVSHIWGNGLTFTVSESLSSIDIVITNRERS